MKFRAEWARWAWSARANGTAAREALPAPRGAQAACRATPITTRSSMRAATAAHRVSSTSSNVWPPADTTTPVYRPIGSSRTPRSSVTVSSERARSRAMSPTIRCGVRTTRSSAPRSCSRVRVRPGDHLTRCARAGLYPPAPAYPATSGLGDAAATGLVAYVTNHRTGCTSGASRYEVTLAQAKRRPVAPRDRVSRQFDALLDKAIRHFTGKCSARATGSLPPRIFSSPICEGARCVRRVPAERHVDGRTAAGHGAH